MNIKERITCIITIDTVMCIMHCRKYHPHNCNRNVHLHNYNKNCNPHICCRNCHLLCAAKTSNCIIATETVTCIIVPERSNNIPVAKYHLKTCINSTDFVTCIIAIKCQLHIPTEASTCRINYRIFQLQKFCQPEILLASIKKSGE